jgi:hypothetical protein
MHLQVQSASNAGTARPQTRHIENWRLQIRYIENRHNLAPADYVLYADDFAT